MRDAVAFTDRVRPVCLSSTPIVVNEGLVISGFGRFSDLFAEKSISSTSLCVEKPPMSIATVGPGKIVDAKSWL